MAEIARFHSFDGDSYLLVPGTDPAQILTEAAGEIDDDEVILTPPDEITVEWWRTSPCHPNSCGEGPHNIHYTPTSGRPTRGGFQAAALALGYRADQDALEAIRHAAATQTENADVS